MICAIGIGLMLAGFILAVVGFVRIVGSPDWQWHSLDDYEAIGHTDAEALRKDWQSVLGSDPEPFKPAE